MFLNQPFTGALMNGSIIRATPEELSQKVINVLRKKVPVKGEDHPLYDFIARWPEYTGGWLLWLCGLLDTEINQTQARAAYLHVEIDKYLSMMHVSVFGIPPFHLPAFNDYFIRREQFITFSFIE